MTGHAIGRASLLMVPEWRLTLQLSRSTLGSWVTRLGQNLPLGETPRRAVDEMERIPRTNLLRRLTAHVDFVDAEPKSGSGQAADHRNRIFDDAFQFMLRSLGCHERALRQREKTFDRRG